MILTGRGRILVVLAAAILCGCGDAQKREAGKNLREATDQARRLYSHALKLLSNPATGENAQPDALDPQALKSIDQAHALLSDSLSKNYDAVKSNPDNIPSADAGMAKMMLGRIDCLRAQYYTWGFDQSVHQAEAAMSQLRQDLDQAQVRGTLLNTTETYATLSDDVINKAVEDTQKTKAKLDETIDGLNKDIRQKEANLAERKKSIEEKTSQSVALRTEVTLSRGVESQKKLEDALKIEADINTIRNEMQTIESELIPQRATLAAEEIRQTEAQTKITALKDIQGQRSRGVEEITKTIEERKEEFAEACKSVTTTTAELDSRVSLALEQSGKAQAALVRANNAMDQVFTSNLLDSDKRAASLSEWAHVKAAEGALQRSMLLFQVSLKSSSDRLARVWDGLHSDKPSLPAAAGVTAFLEASSRAQETTLESYAQSVERLERAVQAAPREDNWQFKRELVVGQLDYARVLDLAGRAAEATDLRNKARTNFADVESAATRAGKPRSIVALKKYVLEEAGS